MRSIVLSAIVGEEPARYSPPPWSAALLPVIVLFTIVGWESACLASPAFDAATFLGQLRNVALSGVERSEAVEDLAGLFRREYLKAGPATNSRELAVYEALVLARHALQAARGAGHSNGQASGRVLRLAEAGLQRLEDI